MVQAVGKTTHQLNALNEGDAILDVVGPLGKAVGRSRISGRWWWWAAEWERRWRIRRQWR